MKCVIWGTGGVGGYVAGALAESGTEVVALTTRRHVTAIRENGLRVIRDSGDYTFPLAGTSSDPAEVGPADVVIATLKLYQLAESLDDLGPLIGPDTVIVTLENGVAAPGMIAEAYPNAHVAAGLTTMVSYVEDAGVIRQVGGTPRVVVAQSASDGVGAQTLARLVKAFDPGWVHASLSTALQHDLWRKFALIATFGGCCALANATIGEVRDCPDTRDLLTRSLAEVQQVAAAEGVTLTDDDLASIEHTLTKMAPTGTTSMQRDLREGKPSELDYLNGHLVDLAHAHDLSVQFHEIVTAVLRLHAARGHC